MTTTLASDQNNGTEDLVLLRFAKTHLDGALRLSQEMSWPYRIEDWDFALRLGHGFVLQSAGVVIGTAVWLAYGETHASAGMIIVAKAHQGRGYGAQMMDALLKAAHPRIVTLNSTAEGEALYQRRGFIKVGVVHQHQGFATASTKAPPLHLVRAMNPEDFEAIASLDREATGWERGPLLRQLFQIGDGHVLLRDGRPRGFAICRVFGRGHVIGPVVAESPGDARIMIESALARLGTSFVRLDTSLPPELGAWLEAIGLERVGEATTMVRGKQNPLEGPARMFALANQSFN